MPFNFTNLADIYRQAIKSDEPTIVFELQDGVGRFVFMMFFSEDDKTSKDQLFLLLGRTRTLLSLKMYGNHKNGNFNVYLKSSDEAAIRNELDIQGGLHPFSFQELLERLNRSIPQTLPLTSSIETLQRHKKAITNKNTLISVIDEASKIYLIGPKKLEKEKKPRERTLRKLYLHVQARPEDIAKLIRELKHKNMTLAWTDDPSKGKNNLQGMMSLLRR